MTTFEAFKNKATFICGYPKSGTTLLLSLLDGHPELLVLPEESYFFNYIYPAKDKAKAILKETHLSNLSRNEVSDSAWGARGYPNFNFSLFESLVQSSALEAQDDRETLLAIMSAFSSASGEGAKKRWVEKTPHNEYYYHIMRQWFGSDLVCIHIVRDPRDNFASYRKHRKNNNRELSAETFALRWALSCELGLRLARQFPHYHMVRYEDLTTRPSEVLQSICSWLGVSYDEKLLAPTLGGGIWGGNSMHGHRHSGITAQSVGLYKEQLSREEIEYLDSVLANYIQQFEYTASKIQGTHIFDRIFFKARLTKLVHWHYRHVWSARPLPAWFPGVYSDIKKQLKARVKS